MQSIPLFMKGWRTGALVQLLATVGIITLVPGNYVKLLALAVLWGATFRRVTRGELVVWILSCTLFVGMDIATLRQGQFAFERPDLAGLPIWEFVVWGFYVVHVLRTVGGGVNDRRVSLPIVLAVVFALPFALVRDPVELVLLTGLLLAIVFVFFHTKQDFAYAGYMALLGGLVEYGGVMSNQWAYRDAPSGGVPFWFVTMWAGIGVFTCRLFLPLRTWVDRRWNP